MLGEMKSIGRLSAGENEFQGYVGEVGYCASGKCDFACEYWGVVFYASEVAVLQYAGEDGALKQDCASQAAYADAVDEYLDFFAGAQGGECHF